MKNLYQSILLQKDIELKDIANIDDYIEMLIQNKREALNGWNVQNPFPFDKGFKEEYTQVLQQQLKKEKEEMYRIIVSDLKNEDQVFETEVTMIGDLGYLRYLFPIPYAIALIEQSGMETQKVRVDDIYLYSQHVEVNPYQEINTKSPIIVLEYPYAYPGFFVLDGNHRVHQCHKRQEKYIDAFILSERTIPLLTLTPIFSLLYRIHQNISMIVLYMRGEIPLFQLKKGYHRIGNERWIG
jgi:hypothetical protein